MIVDPAVKFVTKKDKLVEELRHLILSGEFEQGGRMRQSELASRFATSITPVREALRQLEAEGLLESQPHRGVRVATPNFSEIKGTYIVRRLVEPYVMQRAVLRLSPLDLEKAERLLEQMESHGRARDFKELGKANREFHFTFLRRSGIPALSQYVMNLYPGFPVTIFHAVPERLTDSAVEHRAILDAGKAADVDAVRTATEIHLMESYRALGSYLGKPAGSDPFELAED